MEDEMKKNITCALSGIMAAAIVLSGCGKNTEPQTADTPDLQELIDIASQEMSMEIPDPEAPEASTEEISSPEAAAEDSIEKASSEKTSEETPVEVVSNKRKPEAVELMDGEPLSDEELKQFEEFLNTREGYGLASQSFSSPDKINWDRVFCFGSSTGNCEYSQEALKVFLDARGLESVEALYSISGSDVRAFVEAKTGISDFNVASMTGFVYVESEDVLFDSYGDPFIYDGDTMVDKGVRSEGKIQLLVKSTFIGSNNRVITVIETGDPANPYHYYSNRELWENNVYEIIDARDYDTNETIPCGISYFTNGPHIEIVQGDVVVYTTILKHLTDGHCRDDVKDIAFGDMDGDGIRDMVIIWTHDGEPYAVLKSGTGRENLDFFKEKSAVTDWLGENVKDLTIDNVVDYLRAHQDKLNSFDW